jgi:hypothetical protein
MARRRKKINLPFRAIVVPVATGKDWTEPGPPIAVCDSASKEAAVAALHEHGYRVIWRGGLFEAQTVTAEELREATGGSAIVTAALRRLGYELPDGAEIKKYIVTVSL